MPNIHDEQSEEHRCRIKDIDKELVVIDVKVHFGALRRGELDSAENDSVLKEKELAHFLRVVEGIWKG